MNTPYERAQSLAHVAKVFHNGRSNAEHMVLPAFGGFHGLAKRANPMDSSLPRKAARMQGDHGNIDPLMHSSVVYIIDVGFPSTVLDSASMLLHMHRSIQDSIQYASQSVSQLVVPS